MRLAKGGIPTALFIITAAFSFAAPVEHSKTKGNGKVDPVKVEAPAEANLMGTSKNVIGAGYSVLGYVNPDNSLRVVVRSASCFGGCTTFFDGPLYMYKAKLNGADIFELRDHETQPKTVIQLRPGNDDEIIMLNGKKNLGPFATLSCTADEKLDLLFEKAPRSK